jgi:O-antigen ligase
MTGSSTEKVSSFLKRRHWPEAGVSPAIIWGGIGLCGVLAIARAITDANWLYLGIIFAPLLLYLSVMKPFIFPLGAYFFLIPFDQLLSIGSVGGGMTLTKVLGIVAIPMLFVKGSFEDRLQMPEVTVFWWVTLVFYGGISALWAIQPETAVERMPTAGGLLLLYLMVASYRIRRDELETLKWCILAGGILASVLTIYNLASLGDATRATIEIGDRSALLNQLAFDLLLPVSLCIGMMVSGKRAMKKIMFGLILGLILFAVVITGSRGALVGLGAMAIVYVLSARRKLSVGTALLIVGIVVATFTPAFVLERLDESVSTGGAGRTTIWANGLRALSHYWLTGAGLNNFPEAYWEFGYFTPLSTRLNRASHNIYLGIFVELGIIGLLLLILGIRAHYKTIGLRRGDPSSIGVVLKAALWAMIVSSFFLDTLWYKSLWMLWMLIVMNNSLSRGEGDVRECSGKQYSSPHRIT